jgi:hypothetical protein
MKSIEFNVLTHFELSDGRAVLAVENISSDDLKSNDFWELVINHDIILEIKLIEELKLINQKNRRTEKALVFEGDLKIINWTIVESAFIRKIDA